MSLHGQTLALAGLFQAARLVQQTARGQVRDATATRTSIGSIFMTSPANVDAVYPDTAGLATGLAVLREQLGNDNSTRDPELTAYVITLMHLERKLSGRPDLLDAIARGIDAMRNGAAYGPEVTPELIAALAGIYTDTVSTLTPRIMVQGEPAILDATESRDMIRALLLAGMRAAVLWRQCGGGRIRLVLGRKALVRHAQALVRTA
ncbi:MAG: high frequency lysogenization protein HflD [Gammaproteobacteria bacterium]